MRKTALAVLLAAILACMAVTSCQGVTAPEGQVATGAPAQITILHINDTHAHLEDVARRATLVKNVRDEVGSDRVLMFDSGDVFMGTPYFNLMHGKADLEFMNTLGYDAMTLGNHEFDNYDKTPQYLNDFIADAKFPIVCSNIDFSRVPALKDKTLRYIVIEKGGQKFGIIGLTTEDTVEIASPGRDVIFSNAFAAARQAVTELEKKGINKIIALTHIGWDKDIALAQQVSGIDVILGGHSHTLPTVYPTVVTNKEPTLVVQAEAYDKYLGRLDLSFDEKGVLTKYTGALSTIKDVAEDPDYAARLAKYKGPIDELKTAIAGATSVDLDGERTHVRTMETNFGDLVADAFLSKAETIKADVAIVNGGSIRTSIPAGDVSLGQILEVIPFNNDTVAFDISGQYLVAALENGVSQVEAVSGRFPQVAGLRFSYNPANQPGARVQSVDIMTDGVYKPIDKSAMYRVVTNSYMFGGGDGYTAFKNAKNVVYLGFIDYDIVMKYIAQHSPVNPKVEGRIVAVK